MGSSSHSATFDRRHWCNHLWHQCFGQFVRRRSMAAALASNRAVLWVFFLSNPDCHLCVLFVAAGTHKSQLEQPYDNAGFPVNHFHCEAGCADKIYSGRTSSFDGVYHYRGKGCVSV